jgi:hypothetical protein
MSNNFANNPLYLDTVGSTSFYDNPGTIGSILFSGNSDTDSTVLLYNAKNRVLNRGFETWTQGASVAPDKWVVSGADAVIAREGTIVNNDTYSAKLTRAGTNCFLSQNVLGMCPAPYNAIAKWQGKTVYTGMWAYADTVDRVYVEIYDGVDTTTSLTHAGDSVWAWTAPAAHAVNAAATELTIRGKVIDGDKSGYFDNAILFETKVALSLVGQDKALALWYPRPLPFDGLWLLTLTGGYLQVQI